MTSRGIALIDFNEFPAGPVSSCVGRQRSRNLPPTCSAASTSSSSTDSAGWWLMPPGLRRKSIAVGTRAAITMASCPRRWACVSAANPGGFNGVGKECSQALVHGNGRLFTGGVHSSARPRRSAMALAFRSEFLDGGDAAGVMCVAHVEAHPRLARDHVARVGFHRDSCPRSPPSPPWREQAPRPPRSTRLRRPTRRGAGASALCRHGWPGR